MTTITKHPHETTNVLIQKCTANLDLEITQYIEKAKRTVPEEATTEKMNDVIVQHAIENIDEANPNWTFVASRLYLQGLYEKAAKNRGYDSVKKYGDFYRLIEILTEKQIYSANILNKYTKEEIDYLGKQLVAERDLLF